MSNKLCVTAGRVATPAGKWLAQACGFLLLICVALFSRQVSGSEVENNQGEGSDKVVTQKAGELLKDAEWHKNKWQNMPAIIEISAEHLNLLFNRPEIVFGLRRAMRFAWDDTHDYNDGKTVTRYRFSRLGDRQALIEYQSALVEDPSRTASGSFTIEARP